MSARRQFAWITLAAGLLAACQALLDFTPRTLGDGNGDAAGDADVVEAQSSDAIAAADAEDPRTYCNGIKAYFSLDETFVADQGNLTAHRTPVEATFPFDAGKFDGGVYLNDGGQLHLAVTGILTNVTGTLSYWLKPNGWGGPNVTFGVHSLMKMQRPVSPATQNFAGPELTQISSGLLLANPLIDGGRDLSEQSGPVAGWDPNGWNHLAITWQRSSPPASTSVYVNGTVVLTSSVSWEPIQTEMTELVINQVAFPIDGMIDELTIWGRPLTGDEVVGLHGSEALRAACRR